MKHELTVRGTRDGRPAPFRLTVNAPNLGLAVAKSRRVGFAVPVKHPKAS